MKQASFAAVNKLSGKHGSQNLLVCEYHREIRRQNIQSELINRKCNSTRLSLASGTAQFERVQSLTKKLNSVKRLALSLLNQTVLGATCCTRIPKKSPQCPKRSL